MTGDNMDTYLEPLLKELQLLWHEGVQIRDVTNYNGAFQFTLRAILMWCMHDFLALGIVVGCVTKGYHACPRWGPHTSFQRSNAMSKNVYCNHRRWLFIYMNHQFQKNVVAFDGTYEIHMASPQMKAYDILQ